ncbi:MAG: type IX secretion system protein PorQ [Tannerella sp.]|nr:type IX secretion system protein PorQ [Tannerella sp.]
MKYIKLILLALCLPVFAYAQDGEDAYLFLRFPTSSRVNALGGHSVSLVEADPSIVFHNPALLGGETDGMLNVNYMNYISDVNVGSAVFTKAFGERSSWGVGATYINYGSMKEMTIDNEQLGTFSVQDIGLHLFYAYDLSEKWRGGLSMKTFYSTIADYSSFGLAVDAGLSYFNAESDFSFGLALKNIGAQLKSYQDERQSIPWDLQMGITKRMAHAPIRISVTAMYLNRWKFESIDNTAIEAEGDTFLETALKHLVFGVEFIPSENFWLGIGLNPKTKMDMKLSSGNGLGGFTVGGGVKVSRFNIGVSVARYHPSATSLMMSLTMSLSEMKP